MVAFDKFIWNDGNRFEGIKSLAYKTTCISISFLISKFFSYSYKLSFDFFFVELELATVLEFFVASYCAFIGSASFIVNSGREWVTLSIRRGASLSARLLLSKGPVMLPYLCNAAPS